MQWETCRESSITLRHEQRRPRGYSVRPVSVQGIGFTAEKISFVAGIVLTTT
jgi:hypothetical protein